MPYELIHDTIAQQVFDKASTEARTRRKVERFIKERYAAHQERGAKLTRDDIEYVSPYLSQVNIATEHQEFIAYGKRQLQRARRKIRILVIGVIGALTLFSVLALWQWQSAKVAKEDALAQKSIAEDNARVALSSDSLAQVRTQEAVSSDMNARLKATEALLAKRADSLKAIDLGLALTEANVQRITAERRTREAEALTLTARAIALAREDKAIALRIMQAAWERTTNPLPEVKKTISSIYYDQLATAKQPAQPLYIRDFTMHTDEVRFAQFSPSGQQIVTASRDKSAKLWDLSGNLLADLKGHTDEVYTAQFSPSGDQIVTASTDGTAKIWPTSQRIYRYLKEEAVIPELTEAQRKLYGIENFE